MPLQQLLGEIALGDFVDDYYLKRPLSRAGGCQEYLSLADWQVVERIVETGLADLVIGRQHERWSGPGRLNWAKVAELFSHSYTIGIRHAEMHDPVLRDVAASFRQTLRGEVDIHLYCTPAGQPGFGWHYDVEEVFVLQTLGSKRWRLRKNTVNPWPVFGSMPANLRYEREIMPLMECRLEAGDWLYVPSGYWHQTHADSDSISLSIGVRAITALDILDQLRQTLPSSIFWRQKVPPPVREDAGGPTGAFHELIAELGKELSSALGRHDVAETLYRRVFGGAPSLPTDSTEAQASR